MKLYQIHGTPGCISRGCGLLGHFLCNFTDNTQEIGKNIQTRRNRGLPVKIKQPRKTRKEKDTNVEQISQTCQQ